MRHFILILTCLVLTHLVQAEVEVPRYLTYGRSDFLFKALRESCYSLNFSKTSMGRPCNPAFLGLEPEDRHHIQVFFGNNVKYFDEAYRVLNYTASESTVRDLFDQSRDNQFEADLEYYFGRDNWIISFSPGRLSYYSLIRNRVLPLITLYTSLEPTLRGQIGWEINDDLYFGLQARAIARNFIASEFYITDAVTDPEAVLDVRHQNVLYLEPGLIWKATQMAMEPEFSLMVTRLGAADKEYDELPIEPEVELGVNLRPSTPIGNLRVGPHLSFNEENDDWTDPLRLGAVFELEKMSYLGSVKDNEFDIGAFYQGDKFNGGIIFDHKYIENLKGTSEHLNTWYFQVGYDI